MYPERARAVHLAESLHEIMGQDAAREAARRMTAAVDRQSLETTLLWFDVWVALDKPAGRAGA